MHHILACLMLLIGDWNLPPQIMIYRHVEAPCYRHTDTWNNRYLYKHTYKHTQIDTSIQSDIQTHEHTDWQTHGWKDVGRHTDGWTYRQMKTGGRSRVGGRASRGESVAINGSFYWWMVAVCILCVCVMNIQIKINECVGHYSRESR